VVKYFSPIEVIFMIEPLTATLLPETLDQLQRLRLSVISFQNEIAPLPAGEQSNERNEQFNALRLEANALLQDPDFDQKVSPAMTENLVADQSRRKIAPRLSTIVILGVLLALLGLGINSIVLDDVLINSLGCLVSTLGLMLVVGALIVSGMNALPQRRTTNFGTLYQLCQTLLFEINHALNMSIPHAAVRAAPDVPEIPSAVELALDSLNKQVMDWHQKLRGLEEQRLSMGGEVPLELKINIDFVQRELNRTQAKMDQLHGRTELPVPPVPTQPPVPVKPVNPTE
jgi:hypothetical protein